jgi:hypothetical protein
MQTNTGFCAHLESNSLNIYQREKCLGQELQEMFIIVVR